MSRTYKLHPTAMYGGRGPRNMYLSGFSAWSGKRIGWFKDGSTDYAGAVSFYFDFAPVMGKTRESIKLSVICSNTFAYGVPVLYNPKSTDSTTEWTVPDYATIDCEKYGTIPELDLTPWGLPEHDAYVIGGYYRTYSYVDVTDAVLTVVTAETPKAITYNANGGTGAPSVTTLWGETEWDGYLSTTVPTRNGYQFTGWNTQANGGGTQYASGAYISVIVGTVLYAQWTPLYSILDSATNANITEKTTVSWTNRGSFTNTIQFVFGSVRSSEILVSGQSSYQYTIPSSWYNQIPNSTSGTATVYLFTFANGVLIGTSSTTFTVYVKSTVVPSINNPTATGVDLKWGLYLQKYSSVTIGVTGGAAGTGATIKSYSITGPGLTYSVNTNATSASSTSAVLTTSGTATYTVKITDSRNRTAEKTVSITVTAYAEPNVSSVVGVRCNSDGTANPTTGTSIKATTSFTWTSVGQNTLSGTMSYKKHTDSDYTTARTSFNSGTAYVIAVDIAEISSSYDVKVEISDSLGNSSTYVGIVPPVVGIAFGLKNDRARFGGPVEKPGLQIDWPTELNSTLDMTQRRSYSAQLSAGTWYRVLVFTQTDSGYRRGATGHEIVFHITRRRTNAGEESHDIKMLCQYDNVSFVDEVSKSVSGYQRITKIRYTYDSTHGYVDIYASSACPHVTVDFEVHCEPAYQGLYTSGNFVEVPAGGTGTVMTTYSFSENVPDAGANYIKNPDGTMIQWGEVSGISISSSNMVSGTATLPQAFINTSYVVTITPWYTSLNYLIFRAAATASTVSTFNWVLGTGDSTSISTSSRGFRYIAVGRWK